MVRTIEDGTQYCTLREAFWTGKMRVNNHSSLCALIVGKNANRYFGHFYDNISEEDTYVELGQKLYLEYCHKLGVAPRGVSPIEV